MADSNRRSRSRQSGQRSSSGLFAKTNAAHLQQRLECSLSLRQQPTHQCVANEDAKSNWLVARRRLSWESSARRESIGSDGLNWSSASSSWQPRHRAGKIRVAKLRLSLNTTDPVLSLESWGCFSSILISSGGNQRCLVGILNQNSLAVFCLCFVDSLVVGTVFKEERRPAFGSVAFLENYL